MLGRDLPTTDTEYLRNKSLQGFPGSFHNRVTSYRKSQYFLDVVIVTASCNFSCLNFLTKTSASDNTGRDTSYHVRGAYVAGTCCAGTQLGAEYRLSEYGDCSLLAALVKAFKLLVGSGCGGGGR